MAQTRTRRSTTPRSGSPRRTTRGEKISLVSWGIPWTNLNLIGLAVGIGVILIGYLVMSSGIADEPVTDKSMWNNASSTVVAPILLTIAYCVIVPVAIFWSRRNSTEVENRVEE